MRRSRGGLVVLVVHRSGVRHRIGHAHACERAVGRTASEQGQPQIALVLRGAVGQLLHLCALSAGRGIALSGKAEHRAAHLDGDGGAWLEQAWLFHRNQRPEFRIVVLQNEVPTLKPDHCMEARNRHVRDAHIALVPPAKLQDLFRRQRDHVKSSSGVLLRVAHHVLQDYEGRLRPRHLDQRRALLAVVNVRRVHGFAQLASQGPVEVGATLGVGEVQAAFDPMPQAAEVDILDGPLALARSDERVILARALEQADAAQRRRQVGAGVRFLLASAEDAGLVEAQLGLLAAARGCHQLTDAKLEATQFHDITFGQAVPGRGEFADDEPQLLGAVGLRSPIHPEAPISLHEPEEWIASSRWSFTLSEGHDLCPVAKEHHGTRDGELLRVQRVRLKVKQVMGVSRPCARDDLHAVRLGRRGPCHGHLRCVGACAWALLDV
mmetsp:Transcript_127303/g.249460  ORF Transcript_127303/g.249460 Transcript_127303/m.249460 type:complete len:437 (-) Transcript_127303:30-1340(-)